jgi:thiamine-phosphate pyrophosphorylase
VLVTPETGDLGMISDALRQALSGGDVAAVLIGRAGSEADRQDAAERLVPIAQGAGAAAIVIGDTRAAGRSKADGIHIDLGASEDARDVPPLAGDEADAAYVMFGLLDRPDAAETHHKTLAFADWWVPLFEVPCIALAGATREAVADAASTGAEFVAVRSFVWAHEDGPNAAVAEANAVLDEAFATRSAAG